MFMGSHQVVSKHSILGAQMETRHEISEAEVEQRLGGMIAHLEEIEQSWKRRMKRDGRRRRDHAPCRRRNNKLSEKDFEIYLDQKLHMLQQFYVTQKTGKPNEEDPEPEAAKAEKGNKENADCVSSPRLSITQKQKGNKKVERGLDRTATRSSPYNHHQVHGLAKLSKSATIAAKVVAEAL